jgi:F-type H+-transporting ATPase subunit b
MLAAPLADAGLLDINGTVIAEIIAFLVMLGILARWVYPPVIRAAEARQKAIQDQLDRAEHARTESEERLAEAQLRLDDARKQAQEVIDAAARSADQVRVELRRQGEEEGKRQVERAQREIEGEKQKAIDALRTEMADLVATATERVLGETLDRERHRKLIESAITEVAAGDGERGR